MRAGIYARVSTHDQQTLPMQLKAMRQYAKQRKWQIVMEVKEVGSGAKTRPQREAMLAEARRRKLDAIIVWKLDRWGRSLPDLIATLAELRDMGIVFVSLTEALDFATSAGRAMIGLLSVFAEFERDILRERVKAGIAQARSEGKRHGRPQTAISKTQEAQKLYKQGYNKTQIAKKLGIGRTSVIRMLQPKKKKWVL